MQYIRVRLTNALSKPLYINRCIVATSDYPGTRNGYDFEFPAGGATFTRRLPKQTLQSFPLFVRFLPRPSPRFFASRRVAWCTRWISCMGNFGNWNPLDRFLFFSFEWKRDWKRIRNLKKFFEREYFVFLFVWFVWSSLDFCYLKKERNVRRNFRFYRLHWGLFLFFILEEFFGFL